MTDRSQPLYSFLPWVREGFTALVAGKPTQAQPASGRLGLTIRVRINQGAAQFDVPLKLYGPGDVTGIDPREIVRTDPVHLTADFEPTYFPLIEFDRPDFPWLFTPAAPDTNQRLRPWLCLVVVPKVAGVSLRPAEPLSVLTCPRSELPDLEGSWAWAHAQIAWTPDPEMKDANGQKLSDRGQIELVMERKPERTVSRILSLRQLKSNEGYIACLVPTYAAGLKAGLGQELSAADETTLALAWSKTSGSPTDEIGLPVYYHWEFATGASNSFEPLVRRLRPHPIPPEVGRVPMDLHDAGWGMRKLAPTDPAATIGLEGALQVDGSSAHAEPPADIRDELRRVLAGSATAPGADPLVLPPIYGAQHAGENTVPTNGKHTWLRQLNLDPRYRVAAGLGALVVRYQQELLMAAAWEQAAKAKEERQLAVQQDLANHVRGTLGERLARFSPERLAQVTKPLHGSETKVHESSLPGEALSAPFRSLTRSRGPLVRRLREGAEPEKISLVRRIANEVLSGPSQMVAVRAVRLNTRMLPGGAAVMPGAGPTVRGALDAATLGGGTRSGTGSSSPSRSETAPYRPPGTVITAGVVEASHPFLAAATRNMIVSELMPVMTTPLASLVLAQPSAGAAPAEEIALPYFPQPMYELLRDYFPEFFLPGMEHVPPNSVALLQTNQRFIEAYLVGLNHEMSRELLWREFITDYRNTYFRRFWDVPGSSAPEIPPIRYWEQELGANRIPDGGLATSNLVLLIRGDLLRRFPAATIYGSKATLQSGKPAFSGDAKPVQPIFRGTKAPDVTFLGFPISESAARGGGTDPGYFFVIQEQPTAPRFGWEEGDSDMTVVTNSAKLANRTLQRAFRVAIHAGAILP